MTKLNLNTFARLGAALLALCALTVSGPALAGGETTGRVSGFVYDPTGAPLAEVPLTISGTSLLRPMSRQTGDDGRYTFDNLPPGEDYKIEVNVPGFTPIQQTGIKVRLGQTSPVDINLSVLTEQQAAATFQVVEKVNPVLNPDSAQAVAVIEAEKASQTPIFHQVEGMPKQVAGVSNSNTPSVRGGLSRYGKFYVDGLDTTDVTDGSITAPMNFDAVKNFEVIVGGLDAQYNSLGLVENSVTKSGSNQFQVDANFTMQPRPLAAQNNFPGNQPAIYGLYTNNNNAGAATYFYSPVVNFGGPIVKDRLWYYASYQQNFSSRQSPLVVNNLPENRETHTTTSLGRVKFTWQASEKDRVSLGFNLDRNVINNGINNNFTALSAEGKIHRGGEFVILNYDHNFSDDVLFQLQSGMTFKQVNADPVFSDYTTPGHQDLTANIASINSVRSPLFGATGPYNVSHESKWRLQFDPSMQWRRKDHQFKAGVQVSWMIDKVSQGVSGNERFFDKGGICDPTATPLSPACFQKTDYFLLDGQSQGNLIEGAHVLTTGVFFQDRWSITKNWTVIPGIRLDMARLYGSSGYLGSLQGVGPRFSTTYDVTGDHKTLLVAHYGRSNDVGNIFIAQQANPQIYAVTSTTSGGAPFPACSVAAAQAGAKGCSLSGGPAGTSFMTGHHPPTVDELSAGVHREVAQETVLGVDYTYRFYGHMWESLETNRIWDAAGTSIAGFVDPTTKQAVSKVTTSEGAYRRYHGVDFWVQGTPGPWDLLASYTLAFTKGTVGDYFDGFGQNPIQDALYYGYSPDDVRHTLKGAIAYKTGWGLDLGVRGQYNTGTPLWERFGSNPADPSLAYYRSPRGTGYPYNTALGTQTTNDPSSFAELRNPDFFQLDLQARYNVGNALKWKDYKAEIALLVINALNNPEVTGYNANSGATFGYATSHYNSMQAEFIFRIRN